MYGMEWEERFRNLYARAMAAFEDEGARTPQECLRDGDEAFLASLGCSPQEFYDFVEDGSMAGEPSLDEVLAVTRLRREYFLEVQKGQPSRRRGAHEFPSGNEQLEGISWLPRILAKARAKLRGELPPQLMYGCGGDRPFLADLGVSLSEFLEWVQEAGDDDRKVLNRLLRRQ